MATTKRKKGVLGRAVEAESSKTKKVRRELDHRANIYGIAESVAGDLRKLAKVFDDVGPGHAAILRGFAARLDGGPK